MAHILIACEFSGTVRDAFRARGHDAVSCDVLETEVPGPHYHGDVRDILSDGWDLMIAHPPCTYLARSGLHWNKRQPGRDALTAEALEFVRLLLSAPIPRIAVENPPGRIGTAIRKADQYVQPWQYGHDARKMTGLWLVNLPCLQPTVILPGGNGPRSNTTATGQCKLGPGPDRWMERSRTYQGIADAMADQWGSLLSE